MANVSPQARKNLGLVVKPMAPASFLRTIEIPAVITDRPGVSDRGVISPVTAVVTQVLIHPGDTVEPDQPLFVLRMVSERLHASQLELFKATREMEIQRQHRQRLAGIAESGVVPQSRIIDIDNRLQLLDVTVQAYRQELVARGLSKERVDAAARGEFVTEVTVRSPSSAPMPSRATGGETAAQPFRFELQSLKVELGQQVEPGTVLCELADHRALVIEGHAFKADLPLLQEAARTAAAIEVDFGEHSAVRWPDALPPLRIEYVANTIDPETRVVNVLVPLANQWQSYMQQGKMGILWRFRPGDRVRLQVPVEELANVFVLPREAVVRDGSDAYVFRQNGDLFDRRPVHVLDESRSQVAIANDGSIKPGSYLAQNGAASLNRIVKAQAAQGLPAGVHVHADGTVHGAH